MLPRWRWSISKAVGSVTDKALMLASPGRVRRSNWRLGLLERFVFLPSWRTVIDGLNLRFEQFTAMNGEKKSLIVPWSPIPCEATLNGEQLVGLIVKLGRSMLTWIERIRIGIPPTIEGTVSETALTCAVRVSTLRATRTTTTP